MMTASKQNNRATETAQRIHRRMNVVHVVAHRTLNAGTHTNEDHKEKKKKKKTASERTNNRTYLFSISWGN